SSADADELYGIRSRPTGSLGIPPRGELALSHRRERAVPIVVISDALREQAAELPVVRRSPDIIEDRRDRLHESFGTAVAEAGDRSHYPGVYPIKVTQRRVVLEPIAGYGGRYRTGLEAGSKAELALCLAHDTHDDALLCCNGFKDDDFIRLALWGRKLA